MCSWNAIAPSRATIGVSLPGSPRRAQSGVGKTLAAKWRDLFGATFDIILCNLASTYFEVEASALGQAKRGDSRVHRLMWRLLRHCRYAAARQRVEWEWNREK